MAYSSFFHYQSQASLSRDFRFRRAIARSLQLLLADVTIITFMSSSTTTTTRATVQDRRYSAWPRQVVAVVAVAMMAEYPN